jgi:flagellar M-ring protein FliF
VPLPQEELDKLTALVQEAIGFNKERGDSVKVINAPFKIEAPVEPDAVPLWKQPWAQDLMRAAGVPLALALVALGLIFGVIRPAVKQALTPPPPSADEQKSDATALSAVVDDVQELPGAEGQTELPALEAPKENAKLEAARKLARENPNAVANIVRDWVNGEA